jgi:hypothetical protein
MNVIYASAYGLPAAELSGAHIEVSTRLNVPEVFHEHRWNVTKIVRTTRSIEAQAFNKSAARPEDRIALDERYGFLWSMEERERRKAGSWFWRNLPKSYADVRGTENVLLTCLMIEERFMDALGQAPVHSQYYQNDQIIEGIAHFLETGESPIEEN